MESDVIPVNSVKALKGFCRLPKNSFTRRAAFAAQLNGIGEFLLSNSLSAGDDDDDDDDDDDADDDTEDVLDDVDGQQQQKLSHPTADRPRAPSRRPPVMYQQTNSTTISSTDSVCVSSLCLIPCRLRGKNRPAPFPGWKPRAGSRVVRIDPLRFLAGSPVRAPGL